VNDQAAEYLRRLIAEQPELARKAFYRRSEVHAGSEWLRITSLPRRPLDLDSVPDLTPLWAQPNGKMRLWPVQSLALLEAERSNGLFAAVPVGGGKTLLATLLPDAMKSKRAVILVPAQSKRKKAEKDWPALQEHWKLPLERIALVSYTQLERAPGDILERIEPDLVVADEAHYLKNKDAARTARFLRYFKNRPGTRLVAMSGTFTTASLHDYAHLIKLCLRNGSPLPADYMTLAEWAEAIDVSEDPRPAGALDRLCESRDHAHGTQNGVGVDHANNGARSRFGCRLVSTPGVIALPAGFKGVPLTLRRREITPPPKINAAIDRLRKTWVIGDPEAPPEASEEITDDIAFARFLRQLACGFYLRWDWPGGNRDHEWLEARSRWNSVVRHVLRYSRRPNLDSPMLVAGAAFRRELNQEQMAVWDEWAAVKDRRQPPTVAVWLDRYMVEHAAKWVKESSGRIVWYDSPTLGEEIAKEIGVTLPDRAVDIVMDGSPLVLSIRKFNMDVDGLQHSYTDCLYTTVPNAKEIEQSLGRIHRPGQTKPVTAEILMPIDECLDALRTTATKARYAEETKFGEQKLLHCTLEGIELEDM